MPHTVPPDDVSSEELSSFPSAICCGRTDWTARAQALMPEGPQAESLARMFKALGDPTRLRLLLALMGGEMCVGHLAQFLGASESAISHHLRHLRQLALVRRRRQGQMLFYSLDDDHVEAILKIGLEHQAHSEGRSAR